MKKIKKFFNYLIEEGVFDPYLVFCYIVIIALIVIFVIHLNFLQLVDTVTVNISDFGYADEYNYYVYIQDEDSDVYELCDDIPISYTQVYYIEDETAQSYITYDINRGGSKRNIKIYSTEKIK
jgi:hypothetical protein